MPTTLAPLSSVTKNTGRTIIVVVSVLLIAIWGPVALSVTVSRQAAVESAKSEGRNIMVAFRDHIAMVLHGIDSETDLIERRMREGSSFNLYAWGRERVLISPGLAGIGIIDPDGKLTRTTMEPDRLPTDLSDRAHFRIHLDGRFHGLYVGETIISRISGLPVLPVSRRVEAEDGSFLGVVVALLSPSELTALRKSIDLGPNGIITLSDLHNTVRARFSDESPQGTVGIGRSIAGAPRPETFDENGEGSFINVGLMDSVTRVYSYGRIGNYPLVVTIGQDYNRALATWRSYAAIIIAMAGGVTLLLVGLAIYLIRRDASDIKLANANTLEVTHSAEHDFLTGLPNRLLLNDRISQATASAQRRDTKVAVLFLDLDGFKHVNDSLGHPMGDKLLQSIAGRLKDCVRSSDTICRQGGDEFIALLSEVQRPEDAAIAARNVLKAVAALHSVDEHDLHITTSIGISIYPEDGLDAETLVKNADTAMYQAKDNGRQRYQFFTPAMNIRAVERQSIEEGLRRALERQEFALHYQPKIDLRTGKINGAEALLRWTHPTRGSISPAEFIPVAEDCGLILPIGAWVLREACRQSRAWIDAGLPATTIAVNVSALEFRDPQFLENLFEVLRETHLDPSFLAVELTESLLMKRAELAAPILNTLRGKGVQVAIDDFGTGYSSLSYLRKFPIDALKIDQSFVRQISTAGEDTAIVTAIINMARSLKLRVIAEGVETIEELVFLKENECDEGQGYYFSRPVPAQQFAKLLSAGLPERFLSPIPANLATE